MSIETQPTYKAIRGEVSLGTTFNAQPRQGALNPAALILPVTRPHDAPVPRR